MNDPIYPDAMIFIPLMVFWITFIIVYSALLIFTKFRKALLRHKIAIATGLSHFACATYLCVIVALSIEKEPMAGMTYFYLYVFDYPFFFVIRILNSFLQNILPYNALNVIPEFISFSILGSLFYGYLSLFIGYLIGKIKEHLNES